MTVKVMQSIPIKYNYFPFNIVFVIVKTNMFVISREAEQAMLIMKETLADDYEPRKKYC